MLARLRIENLAVVENVELAFGPGLNVLTGSTGAGKSLILSALNLLLGDKADGDAIRQGSDEARVEAEFTSLQLPTDAVFAPGVERQGPIVVARRVTRAGRSHATVDGRAATLKELRALCAHLIEPHGQNEQYRLRDPAAHVSYLDAFAENAAERARYGVALAELRRAQAELERFDAEVAAARERRELLAHRVDDVERVAPRPGEKSALEATARVLAHAEKIHAAMADACASLYDDEVSASAVVGRIERAVSPLASLDARVAEMAALLAEARAAIDQAAAHARDVIDGLEFEPAEVERLQERLDALTRLEQRYRLDADTLWVEAQSWKQSLAQLDDADLRRSDLVRERDRRAHAVAEAGTALSRSRVRAAAELDRRVTADLAGLHMRGAAFRTVVATQADVASPVRVGDASVAAFDDGLDVVRMRARTNPGEAEGGVETIASSGELSRMGLVIKSLAGSGTAGSTLVFDEIDAGVGADLGDVLGEKLLALAERHQIICITHMPQIAAKAPLHLGVVKEVDGARTRVRLRRLEGDERTREIARMLGGDEGSDRRMALAHELLTSAPRRSSPSTRVRP
jgi:DNA repair protein RecN (Recombination protein N)